MEVTLLWNVCDNRLAVTVTDIPSGDSFIIDTEHRKALDVFYHPYAHAAFREGAA